MARLNGKQSRVRNATSRKERVPRIDALARSRATTSRERPKPIRTRPRTERPQVNAWKRVLNKSMGKSEFVGSRLQRVARKINPLTECVTDDECAVEIETSAAFFVEPEGGDEKQNEV